MTINEIEAHSMSSLIDAFIEFKKGGNLIDFYNACQKRELINEHGKFSEGDIKYLKGFNKKLKEIIKKAENNESHN